ncbi:hypothetical protein GCK72_007508 [Caenorhabditis remanei]|uniref:Uncharacterized protein n=1 Tax=Caenorhabditis remanei TaxID=31234 RepID=A0A6A5HJA9_CAERE|nr:hypothetical protein GCK72_007508 [Caenorhabditis remanei]KAF1767549.1 hypothetical protein GCK72_007508 [Caenorhabditis remanei]
MNKKSRIRQILDRIRQDVVGVVTVDDKCVIVPMKSDSQRIIQISYGTNDYELASYKLKIEVIPTNLT